MKQDQIGDEFMEYPLIRECIANGVYFSSITDKKFKHNRISVNLIVKLDREKVTDRAVVPFILRQGSKNCPDFTDLNKNCVICTELRWMPVSIKLVSIR